MVSHVGLSFLITGPGPIFEKFLERRFSVIVDKANYYACDICTYWVYGMFHIVPVVGFTNMYRRLHLGPDMERK